MRLSVASTLTLLAGAASAASSWTFGDATVQAVAKSGVVDSSSSFGAGKPAAEPVALGATDKLKVSLTTKLGSSGKRPHQAFVVVRQPASGLEAPFALTVKDSGKAVVEIVRSPFPSSFLCVCICVLTVVPGAVSKGSPRPAAYLAGAPPGQPGAGLVWLGHALGLARVRHCRAARPRRQRPRLRGAPALRQAARDPPHFPRRPQEPARDCVGRVCPDCHCYGPGLADWGMSSLCLCCLVHTQRERETKY